MQEIFRRIITSRTENRVPFGLDINEEEVDKAVESIKSIENFDSLLFPEETASKSSSSLNLDESENLKNL